MKSRQKISKASGLTLSLVLGAALGMSSSTAFAEDSSPAPVASSAPTQSDVPTFSESELMKALSTIADGSDQLGQSLAKGVTSVIADWGNPTGIIVGNEGSGALFVGYRKGAGWLVFKGDKTPHKIYWNAPSIGFNVGGSASKVAVLVYGAKTPEELMQRFGSAQGSFHMVAGASISYMHTLDDSKTSAQLAYVAVGVGFDAGISIETLAFTPDERWLPFSF